MIEGELTLVLCCHDLPGTAFDGQTDCRLGIQKGSVVIEDVPADRKEVLFTFPIRVLLSTTTDRCDFRGPFVQGKVGERFVYLCWGQRVGEHWNGLRRAKFPLRHLDRKRLLHAMESRKPVVARLDMTDAKGLPLTATIHESSFVWEPSP